tara:strand:- start:6189 stop:6314 length:126 start_codon:yes stop_codon:yes gene_type:complete
MRTLLVLAIATGIGATMTFNLSATGRAAGLEMRVSFPEKGN